MARGGRRGDAISTRSRRDLDAISTRSRCDLAAISRLHELGVLDGYPREILDPSLHGVNRRVAQAALTAAPCCRRRARRLNTIAGERPRPPRAALRPGLEEGVGLGLAEQIVERDDPWRSAPHRRAGPRGEAFEHCVRRSGRRRGGRSRLARALRHALGAARDARPRARLAQAGDGVALCVREVGLGGPAHAVGAVVELVLAVGRLAKPARHRALRLHEAWVGLALAYGCPRGAVGVGVLAVAALLRRDAAATEPAAPLALLVHEPGVRVALPGGRPVRAALARDVAAPGLRRRLDRAPPPRWSGRRGFRDVSVARPRLSQLVRLPGARNLCRRRLLRRRFTKRRLRRRSRFHGVRKQHGRHGHHHRRKQRAPREGREGRRAR